MEKSSQPRIRTPFFLVADVTPSQLAINFRHRRGSPFLIGGVGIPREVLVYFYLLRTILHAILSMIFYECFKNLLTKHVKNEEI